MARLRTVIADDERPAREYLKRLLVQFDGVEIVGEARDGAEAVSLITQLEPDIAFLDLQMPEMTGLDVVGALDRVRRPLIAFVTAFDEFAINAFDLNAVDYLLKPVEKDRLAETLDRAFRALEKGETRTDNADRVENAIREYESAVRGERLTRIPVRKRDDFYLIPVEDVASVEADGELLHLATNGGEKYSINFRLKDLESRLDVDAFVRVSRSVLVNIRAIVRVTPLLGGTFEISLENGQAFTSSRSQSRAIRGQLLRI